MDLFDKLLAVLGLAAAVDFISNQKTTYKDQVLRTSLLQVESQVVPALGRVHRCLEEIKGINQTTDRHTMRYGSPFKSKGCSLEYANVRLAMETLDGQEGVDLTDVRKLLEKCVIDTHMLNLQSDAVDREMMNFNYYVSGLREGCERGVLDALKKVRVGPTVGDVLKDKEL